MVFCAPADTAADANNTAITYWARMRITCISISGQVEKCVCLIGERCLIKPCPLHYLQENCGTGDPFIRTARPSRLVGLPAQELRRSREDAASGIDRGDGSDCAMAGAQSQTAAAMCIYSCSSARD